MTDTVDCDVVVVGAGVAGALVARALAEQRLSVAVLEATAEPGGVARHGLGVAILGTPEPYVTLAERVGGKRAAQIWQLTRRNLELLAETLRRYDVPFERVGTLRTTGDGDEAQRYRRSVDLLTQQGYQVSLEDATDYGYLVGLRTTEDVAFEPPALIEKLLDHPNITLETDAEVQAVKSGQDGDVPIVSIWAHKRYLRARGAVLTAGAFAVHLDRHLAHVLSPRLVQIAEVQERTPLPAVIVVEGGEVAVRAHGDRWRFVGRGDGTPTWSRLAKAAQQFCPEAKITARRSGWVAASRDGLPVVGELPGAPKVYVIGGLGAWGLSWAWIAAERLTALMVHDEAPGPLALNRPGLAV